MLQQPFIVSFIAWLITAMAFIGGCALRIRGEPGIVPRGGAAPTILIRITFVAAVFALCYPAVYLLRVPAAVVDVSTTVIVGLLLLVLMPFSQAMVYKWWKPNRTRRGPPKPQG